MRHYSIDDVLVRAPPSLKPAEDTGEVLQTQGAHRSACHSLPTTGALGDGEETVTITEFSNGNGSLAVPNDGARKRDQDSATECQKGREAGVGRIGYVFFPIPK